MTPLSPLLRRASALALLLAACAAQAVGLPDTGQTTCYNDTAADGVAASDPASIARDAGTHPRQDCRYGRDPAAAAGAVKIGGGRAGLDYSKITNAGAVVPLANMVATVLGSNPGDWACTLDNITGLMWEVKTPAGSGLRDWNNTYTWYNSDGTTNGGNAGTVNGGICSGGSGCDTEKFVFDVNVSNLCNYADWRMPSIRELMTLLLLDGTNPTNDYIYFAFKTKFGGYSSATSSVQTPTTAMGMLFQVGLGAGKTNKSAASYVRLVRGAQF